MSGTLPGQAARYLGVGGVVFLADFATYAAVVLAAPRAFLAANVIGKLVGAGLGFVLHRRFTFAGEQRGGAGRQALSYAGLLLFNLGLSSALLWLAVAQADMDRLVARILIDAIVVATSFLGMRMWVYRPA